MRLENLYPNFGTASPEDQAAFMSAYRFRRAEDMAKPSTWPKTKTKASGKSSIIDLSEEEKALMKLLGLKRKDMITLKALTETESEEDDSADLLKDSTFNEEEES